VREAWEPQGLVRVLVVVRVPDSIRDGDAQPRSGRLNSSRIRGIFNERKNRHQPAALPSRSR
jgi:hypothetical protein